MMKPLMMDRLLWPNIIRSREHAFDLRHGVPPLWGWHGVVHSRRLLRAAERTGTRNRIVVGFVGGWGDTSCRGSLQHATAGSGPTSSEHAPPLAPVPPTRCRSVIGSEATLAIIGSARCWLRDCGRKRVLGNPYRPEQWHRLSLLGVAPQPVSWPDPGELVGRRPAAARSCPAMASMLPSVNPVASAKPPCDCGWPCEAPSSAGATRRTRLGHGCEKPLTLDPGMPAVPESESEPVEDSDGALQSSTSTMSMKIL
jgi:hypothetical protein